jgi:hypothetical protein
METWQTTDVSWLAPLEADRLPQTLSDLGLARARPFGLEGFAEDCLALSAELDRELAPLHRLGEELLARIAPPTSSARMA